MFKGIFTGLRNLKCGADTKDEIIEHKDYNYFKIGLVLVILNIRVDNPLLKIFIGIVRVNLV